MKKAKKIKIFIGLIYLVILGAFLYFLFQNFSFEDISSIKVIQHNKDQLNLLKENNLILLISIFFIFTVLWVFLLGVGSPIALIGGFIFGKWIGTIIITLSLSVGALCLYLLGKYFLYNFLKENLYKKFKKLHQMFKKKQLFVMILFRIVVMIPFFFSNLFFNINDTTKKQKKPIKGKYISGKIINENKDGNLLKLYIALLKPLPKLANINIDGKSPINVPKK